MASASPNSQLLFVETSIVKLIEEVEQGPALYKKEYSDTIVNKKQWEDVCKAVVTDFNQLSADEKTYKVRNTYFYLFTYYIVARSI